VINKIASSAREAVKDIPDGATVLISGLFGVGQPDELIQALADRRVKNLTVVSNGVGFLEPLYLNGCIKKSICTLPKNKLGVKKVHGTIEAVKQRNEGDLEVEIVPQSLITERINAGTAGIAAFYTSLKSNLLNDKEVREFDGVEHVLEYGIKADYALIAANTADEYGNLSYVGSVRCSCVEMAMNASHTIAQVETIQDIDPNSVVTSGAFVDCIVQIPRKKLYWRQTKDRSRDKIGSTIGQRIAKDLPNDCIVEFGFGLPWHVFDYLPLGSNIMVHSEGVLGIERVESKLPPDTFIRSAAGDIVKFGKHGCAQTFDASFKLVTSGRIDIAVLGAFQADVQGNFAGWTTDSTDKFPAIGGSLELATRSKQLYIAMRHLTDDGVSKIVSECSLPITARGVVKRIYTDLATLEVTDSGLRVLDIVGDMSHNTLEELTGIKLIPKEQI
jgi:3-oxoacid CoA-transferase